MTTADGQGMRVISTPIRLSELAEMATGRFGDLVKAVVDVERGVIVVDAEMHADEEAMLLDHGSLQEDLLGINLYPDQDGTPELIVFDSMINVRPRQGNRSRSVEDPGAREAIIRVVGRLIAP